LCWLFVGSSIFSASFALLGGRRSSRRGCSRSDMTPVQFMILAQVIIFPAWLAARVDRDHHHLHADLHSAAREVQHRPLFFGLLVALNLQTAFLSPPVAMAAFYLKGVAPRCGHAEPDFRGMLPFMGIQIVALVLLYIFPEIGLWLPKLLYK
jgi:TRAP-type mannitol/chloroaromatic compound transport system permease large subunit